MKLLRSQGSHCCAEVFFLLLYHLTLVLKERYHSMKTRLIVLALAILSATGSVSLADFPQVTKIGQSTVHQNALTLSGDLYGYAINGLAFQQEAVVSHNGWQYVAYYNNNRRVCLSRRALPDGPWQTITFTDYRFSYHRSMDNDAHNVVTLGICPKDGTIHLAFDHHNSPLHYRISQPGVASNPEDITWQASLFSSVRDWLEPGKRLSDFTYPQFWQTPEGNLQICYRLGGSGGGDLWLADYDGQAGQWKDSRQIINRSGTYSDRYGTSYARNAYQNNTHYGPDGILHFTWTWRETAGAYANHDIMYAWSDDGGFTWYNNSPSRGISLAQADEATEATFFDLRWPGGDHVVGRTGPDVAQPKYITLDSEGITIAEIDRYYGLMNTQAQATDPQGRIHVVMWHCTDETIAQAGHGWSRWGHALARRYYHYWQDFSGNWHRNELPHPAGSRPRMVIDENGDAFLIYQSHPNPAALGHGIYYTNGNLTIQAATARQQWTDWQIVYEQQGPFLNEMLVDHYRFEQTGILSVMVQDEPAWVGASTPLRIIDLEIH